MDSDSIGENLEIFFRDLNTESFDQQFPHSENYPAYLMSIFEEGEPEIQLLAAQCVIRLARKNNNEFFTPEVKDEILQMIVEVLKPLPSVMNASLEEQYQMTVELLTFLADCRNSVLWPRIFTLIEKFYWHQNGMSDEIFCICCKVFTDSLTEIAQNQILLNQIRKHYFSTIHYIRRISDERDDVLQFGYLLVNGTNTDLYLKECIFFFDKKDGWQLKLPWQYRFVSVVWANATEEAQKAFLFPNMTNTFMRHLYLGDKEVQLQTMKFLIVLFNSSWKAPKRPIDVKNNTNKLTELFVAICDKHIRVENRNYYLWDRFENRTLALDCFQSIKEKAKEIAPKKRDTFSVFLTWMLENLGDNN